MNLEYIAVIFRGYIGADPIPHFLTAYDEWLLYSTALSLSCLHTLLNLLSSTSCSEVALLSYFSSIVRCCMAGNVNFVSLFRLLRLN